MDLNLFEQAIQSLDASEGYMAQYGKKSLFAIELLHRANALNGLRKYERALETIDNTISFAK